MERDRRTALLNRLQVVGLFVALLTVAIGVGSMVAGIGGKRDSSTQAGDPDVGTRVEVLNAAGVPGLAREGTRRLRDAGFDVVHFGNAGGAPRAESVVLDRAGNLEVARGVARTLNISQVRSVPDAELLLEVSVVLGRDWRAPESSPR